jgi:hypothetical protein
MNLILRGGLGNQLFQYAAAMSISGGSPLNIWTATGEPRKTGDLVDIGYFRLPENVILSTGPTDRLSKKIFSFNLRFSLRSNSSLVKKTLKPMLKAIADVYISIKAHKLQSLITADGVGFSQVKLKSREAILNGYFQAEYWVRDPKAQKTLQLIQLKNPSTSFLNWVKRIEIEKPIAVHIRLGDYRLEEQIGVLSPEYFQRALTEIKACTKYRNVWIFSDEPQNIDVSKYIPSGFRARIFSDTSLNPAETLELMRHATGYVISNSTFSWWAAYLSYNSKCCRIMPKPWFKLQEPPLGIKPKDWKEIENPF